MGLIAVYPGTFDPITNGHADLVRRAAPLFERIVVGVAGGRGKRAFFSAAERVALASEVLSPYAGVEVRGFDGLLVNFAREHAANVILRGLRAVSDFEYEFQLAGMNRRLDDELESVFMMPSDEHAFISSGLVREISELGGDVSAFVAPSVEAAMKRKHGR